ncbi:MAG TPA: glycosyltransferase family 4 protein, partial [Polyangia bacterium]|jgi:glycosyltransferase involved in cell wall biosynthesis|nr:glycosyltransferase family 4 protein [Polyangia bacterium]
MGAPSARVYELSREWARLGHDVTVLTGFPNHPTGIVPEAYRGQWLRRETVDGIHVVRTPIYVAANKGLFRRSANYFSFSLSASVVGPWLIERPDVVIATSPQILVGIAGAWLSTVKGVPFVFDVRDLWPRSIVEVGAMRAESPIVKALELLERSLYRRAHHIVVVTHSFVDEIAAHGIPRERISVVTNGVDLDLFRPRPSAAARRALGLPMNGVLVSYIGTHGLAHGLDTALDAAALLAGEPIHFLFVGEGAEKAALQKRANERGLTNVIFWNQRPRTEIAEILAASDVCLVLLRNLPLFRTVLPSKLFEIMGAGRPILSTVDGEARTVLEDAGAGVFVPPEDPQQLAQAIRQLAADPERRSQLGAAGLRHVEAHYSRPALAQSYLKVLEDVIAPTAHEPSMVREASR